MAGMNANGPGPGWGRYAQPTPQVQPQAPPSPLTPPRGFQYGPNGQLVPIQQQQPYQPVVPASSSPAVGNAAMQGLIPPRPTQSGGIPSSMGAGMASGPPITYDWWQSDEAKRAQGQSAIDTQAQQGLVAQKAAIDAEAARVAREADARQAERDRQFQTQQTSQNMTSPPSGGQSPAPRSTTSISGGGQGTVGGGQPPGPTYGEEWGHQTEQQRIQAQYDREDQDRAAAAQMAQLQAQLEAKQRAEALALAESQRSQGADISYKQGSQSEAEKAAAALAALNLQGSKDLQTGNFAGQGTLNAAQFAAQLKAQQDKEAADRAMLDQQAGISSAAFNQHLGALNGLFAGGSGSGGGGDVAWPDFSSANDATFAQAKDKAAANGRGAISAFNNEAGARGITNSGLRSGAMAGIIGGTQEGLGNVIRDQAVTAANNNLDKAKTLYTGGVSQANAKTAAKSAALNALLNTRAY